MKNTVKMLVILALYVSSSHAQRLTLSTDIKLHPYTITVSPDNVKRTRNMKNGVCVETTYVALKQHMNGADSLSVSEKCDTNVTPPRPVYAGVFYKDGFWPMTRRLTDEQAHQTFIALKALHQVKKMNTHPVVIKRTTTTVRTY